jgi:ketosteroid isomerase-like protein
MLRSVLLRHGGVLSLAAALLIAQPARGADEGPRLRSLERDLNRAIAQRDTRRVSDLLADDWILVSGAGKIKTKTDVLADMTRPELEFQAIDTRDVMVRVWGDTAVITGTVHQRYRLRGKQTDVTLRYSDTWTRSGDSWRQVSGHSTRLPD